MMFTRKKILVFSDWYLPGYRAGGPIRSLANMVNSLDHDFYIITRNTDHHSTKAYDNIIPNEWIQVSSNVRVIYFEEKNLTTENFRNILFENTFDRIYLNSLFSPRFTLLPLRVLKKLRLTGICVLAPRGMLKPGALSIKANKKKIFLLIAKLTGLFSGIRWHATNQEEAQEIVQHFGKRCEIKIAPNMTTGAQEYSPILEKKTHDLKLISVARISPEKGILEAIQYLKDAKLGHGISCTFYGTQQNPEYLEQCKKLAQQIEGANISFPGEISHSEISKAMKSHHIFYMTTWGENFGHAIAEALLSAVPVLISNRTPWKNLQQSKAGWDLPLESSEFVKILRICYDMGKDEHLKLSETAYAYGIQKAVDPESIAACYSIFE